MEWHVYIHKNAQKRIKKMPKKQQDILVLLVRDMQLHGAVLPQWSNYSSLGDNKYHCHLSYKWVACWEVKDNMLRIIDIYYVGSREDAPY